jgi:glutathione S-transferase
MSDYDFYYWSVPFRGQFVRAVLTYAGKTWTESSDDSIRKMCKGPIEDLAVPFMGPPMLVDKKADFAIAEMPAIVLYLGETLDLLPATPALRALTIKTVNDANDVIDEITLEGGKEIWTEKRWQGFIPRLKKWMSVWEETGRRHDLKEDSGFMLGGDKPGIADVVTATLWTTMADRFGKIDAVLQEAAPLTAALSQRVSSLPALVNLATRARADYGDAYCGGEIGDSMRKVLNA